MCTVVWRRDPTAGWPLLLLVVRDEFLDRPTDPVGFWWPDRSPGVRGARDARSGGAALAVDPRRQRAAVLVNAAGSPASGRPGLTRGWLAVDAAAGRDPQPAELRERPGFHLLTATAGRVGLASWDGRRLARSTVAAGEAVLTWPGLDQAEHARGRAVHEALRATGAHLGPAPASWSRVLEAAIVPAHPVDGRPYGTVGATLLAWSLDRLVELHSPDPAHGLWTEPRHAADAPSEPAVLW